MFEFSPVEIWLAIGVALILIEFTVPGIGFLFLGFGCISNAILIYNVPEIIHYQFASAGIISLIWFLILWWPLKTFVYGSRNDKHGAQYFDVVGSEVKVVKEAIAPGARGHVLWSGTQMNAQLDEKETTPADVGSKLKVTAIKGNILICKKIS